MSGNTQPDAYIPDVVPKEDRSYYESKQRYGNRVGWGTNPALLIVDMTLAFVPDAADKHECVRANERLLSTARQAGVPVFFTTPKPAGTYPDGYPAPIKASPGSSRGPEVRKSTEDRNEWMEKLDQMIPALEPRENEVVIEKPRASAFFETDISSLLRYYGIDTLVVSGASTSGCVRATVVDSHSSNFRTIVPQEGVYDPVGISHEVGLFEMDMKYADVTSLEEVLDRLQTLGPTE